MRSKTIPALAGAALALFGCSSDFNTPTLLNKVRILAIQAEPPQPALGASTTLRALVYQPPSADAGVGVTGYSWSWCPLATRASDGYACPVGPDAGESLFASIPGFPPFDLGTGETATFTNPFPAATLASLCENSLDAIPALAAGAASGGLTASGSVNFACTIAGFPITVALVVHTTAGDLPAVFNVYLPVNDNIAPNLNPVVGGISVTVDNVEQPLDQAGTQAVLRNSSVPVSIDTPLSDSELLPDPNAVLPPLDPKHPYLPPNTAPFEQLNMHWFAECGDFGGNGLGGRGTVYLGDPNNQNSQFATALDNTWNIPKQADYPADFARMIVVVSDNRGGVAWTSGVAHLVDLLPDAGAPDAPEADSGEPSPDAEALDSDEADTADAVQESAP
ncbi:MAG: hypothetical protein WCE40_13925 [Polyangia bacterium]